MAENGTIPPTVDDGIAANGIFWPGLAAILVFYVVILAAGGIASYVKKSYKGTSEDMMLAGRDIGLVLGIFTMTATWVGGGYINGASEYIAKPSKGLAWCQAPLAYSSSILLGGLFFAKKMRNARYATILDPFQARYGPVMTTFLYIPALLGDILWSGSVLAALGASLRVVVGLDHTTAIVLSTAISMLYTLFGGLYSVSFTDVIQLACIFVGTWLVVPFAMRHDAVRPIADTAHSDGAGNVGWLGHVESNPPEVLHYIDSILMLMFGGMPWQAYYQRVLSQKTAFRAQILSYVAAFGCVFMAIPSMLIGAVAASTNWNETDYPKGIKDDYSLALPLVMRYLTPTPVAIIGLGAVAAAVMSSTDSSILSASSMFARNVYRPLRNRITEARGSSVEMTTDTEVLWVMRVAIFIVGGAACGIAISVDSIYALFYLCSDLVYVVLFPQLTCILYVSWANTYGAATGYALGLFCRLSGGDPVLGIPALIEYPWFDEETHVQYFPFKLMSMLLSFCGIFFGSWVSERLFKREILPAKADVFQCFTKEQELTELKSGLKANGI